MFDTLLKTLVGRGGGGATFLPPFILVAQSLRHPYHTETDIIYSQYHRGFVINTTHIVQPNLLVNNSNASGLMLLQRSLTPLKTCSPANPGIHHLQLPRADERGQS